MYFDFSCIIIPWFILRSRPRLNNWNVYFKAPIVPQAETLKPWLCHGNSGSQLPASYSNVWLECWLSGLGWVEMCGKFPMILAWLSSVHSVEHTALGPAGYFHRETPLWDARCCSDRHEISGMRKRRLQEKTIETTHWCQLLAWSITQSQATWAHQYFHLLKNILVALLLHRYFKQAHSESTNAYHLSVQHDHPPGYPTSNKAGHLTFAGLAAPGPWKATSPSLAAVVWLLSLLRLESLVNSQ